MEGGGGGGEKTEKPTQHRREKAKREGQVAKSQDVGIATSVLSLFIMINFIISQVGGVVVESTERYLGNKVYAEEYDFDTLISHFSTHMLTMGSILLPMMLLPLTLGVGSSIAQSGPMLNGKVLEPKLSRLNPQNWLKRVFSVEMPIEILKALLKGVGVVIAAIAGLSDLPGRLWRLSGMSIATIVDELKSIGLLVSGWVSLLLVLLAIFDIFWTRYRFEKKLMMTRQEVKDELKDVEGSPHVKGAIRRKMMDATNRDLKERVKEATVVTTNPTHYAVALRYWRGKDSSPVVVAKGIDYRAEKIRNIAKEANIPIIEDKPLTRSLYALVQEGSTIPVELYEGVAKILALVYRRRNKARPIL